MNSRSRQRGALGIGFLALFLCVSSVTAHAVSIQWTLVGVTFDAQCLGDRCSGPGVPGGTASGHFVFDPQTNQATSWDLTVQGGDTTLFPAYRWWSGDGKSRLHGSFNEFGSGQDWLMFVGESSPIGAGRERQLRLITAADDLDVAGVAPLLINYLSVECYTCNPARLVVSGELHGAPAPVAEPASVLLVGLGVAWVRLRRKTRA